MHLLVHLQLRDILVVQCYICLSTQTEIFHDQLNISSIFIVPLLFFQENFVGYSSLSLQIFFKKEFFLCQVFLILSIDVFHFSISFEKCNFFEHFLAANNFYIQVYLFDFFFSKIYHVSVYICILVVLFSVWRFNEDDSMF